MTQIPPILVPSTEFVVVQVTHKIAGVVTDPTSSYDGYLALRTTRAAPTEEPEESPPWYPASWESANGRYFLTALVGPSGAVAPTAGTLYVYAKLVGPIEKPVLYCGTRKVKAG